MAHDFDDLQSEPKTKRIKKSKYQYPRSQCDCVASQAGNLKIYVECKHKELKYPCSECDLLQLRQELDALFGERSIEELEDSYDIVCVIIFTFIATC